jgi:hypothetical protein
MGTSNPVLPNGLLGTASPPTILNDLYYREQISFIKRRRILVNDGALVLQSAWVANLFGSCVPFADVVPREKSDRMHLFRIWAFCPFTADQAYQ